MHLYPCLPRPQIRSDWLKRIRLLWLTVSDVTSLNKLKAKTAVQCDTITANQKILDQWDLRLEIRAVSEWGIYIYIYIYGLDSFVKCVDSLMNHLILVVLLLELNFGRNCSFEKLILNIPKLRPFQNLYCFCIVVVFKSVHDRGLCAFF